MRSLFGAGIARRIYLAFLAAAVLPTAIAGVIGVWMSFEKLRATTISSVEQELSARGDSLGLFFGALTSELRFLASGPAALRLLGDPDLNDAQRERLAAEIGEIYARLLRAQPHIYQLRLLDARGMERVRTERQPAGVTVVERDLLQDKSDRYYVREALASGPGALYVSSLDLNEERGAVEKPERPVVRLATGIVHRGQVIGLVVLNVHAEVLIRPVQQMVQGREGTAYLFDASGQFLWRGVHAAGALAMQPVTASSEPAAVLQTLRSGRPGSLNNAGVIWVHAPLNLEGEGTGARHWAMAIAVPERQLLLQVLDLAVLYGVLLAALLAAAVAGYSISRRLVGPLQELAREADAIAAGDFERRVHIGGRDEIALLGERFNVMAARLQATLSQLELHRHRLEGEVTERTRELHAERALLSAVLRHTSDAIAAIRPDGGLLFANDAAQRLMGLSTGTAATEPGALMRNLAGSGEPGRKEVTIGERTMSVSRDRLPVADGAAPIVVVARDVTEERRLSDEKREFDRQLFQLDKLATMGELAVGVAHEIGNPLAGMKAVVQALQMEPGLAPEVLADLQRVEGEIDRLSRFLARFRGLATPPQLHLTAQQLAPAVEDMLFWIRRQARALGVDISVDIAEQLPPLGADPAQLREVLLNLFVNALHAMPDGGSLIVRAAVDEAGMVLIEVVDSGRGIPPEVQSRVFEPFFTTRPDGSGLGLSVCSQVLAEHGGRIEVQSRPGHTRFRIHWPLHTGAAAAKETNS